ILITALRDWLFLGLMLGIAIACMISASLGSTAFIEEAEMTLSYAAGSSRVILMIGLIVFTCFHVRNAFDTKEIDVILSRPISRSALVLAYWLGFSLVALLLSLPIIGIVGLIGVKSWAGFAGWAASVVLEALLVVALALFSALTLRSAVTSVMACMGFYVLSRMMAFFIATAHSHIVAESKFALLRYALIAVSTLVPRLDLYGKSEWLLYGFNSSQDWSLFLIQSALFIPLLLAASIIDFKRKQF
ncbi:MAG: hypothetical protein EBV03_13350, partial [Proteobacteria bacterium]|nr:hypothetical protein [Pseudomonadota bacterium]